MPDDHVLTIDLAEDDAEVLQALLPDWGAGALEVRDREAPPMPGVRGPAPGEAIVVASFEAEDDARTSADEISERFPAARVAIERITRQDWSVAWRTRIRAVSVGRLWVGPPWLEETAPSAAVRVVIEPKMAFGTGDHATTRLCLEAVDGFIGATPGASVLDVGTGTGVLAFAAAKLGAGRVVGIDTDAPSIELAREDAVRNAVEVELSTTPLEETAGRFDLVLANILANTLVELAPLLAARTGRRLVLAGVLRHQHQEVLRAFLAEGLVAVGGADEGDWVRLDLERGEARS